MDDTMKYSEMPNSSDLIYRRAAIDALADMHCKSDEDGYVWIIRSDAWARIDALPSAQPERMKGKWKDFCGSYQCPHCNMTNAYEDNFCPNCGADMRGGQDE